MQFHEWLVINEHGDELASTHGHRHAFCAQHAGEADQLGVEQFVEDYCTDPHVIALKSDTTGSGADS